MKNFYSAYIAPLFKKKIVALIGIFLALVLIFSVWGAISGHNFFQISTFKNIITSMVVSSFLTIGAGCLLISGNMDLAQSTIGCLGGVIIADLCHLGVSPIVCLIVCFAVAAFFGLLDGLLVSKFRFPAFIATLGMSYVVRGVVYIFSAACNNGTAGNLNYQNKVLQGISNIKIIGLPLGVFVMIFLFIIYGILISKTRFGMKMTLVGGNPVAAKLAGINSTKITIILFINASMLAALSGWYNGAKTGQGSINALSGNQFTGMTAAIIGGISFGGGVGGMGGAFVGLMILQTFQIGMSILGVNPFLVTTFSGVLLILALAVDFLSTRSAISGKRKAKEG